MLPLRVVAPGFNSNDSFHECRTSKKGSMSCFRSRGKNEKNRIFVCNFFSQDPNTENHVRVTALSCVSPKQTRRHGHLDSYTHPLACHITRTRTHGTPCSIFIPAPFSSRDSLPPTPSIEHTQLRLKAVSTNVCRVASS